MKAAFTLIATALAAVPFVAADLGISAGQKVHFYSTQNASLVFSPVSSYTDAQMIATTPGNGASSDVSALTVVAGAGVPTQLSFGEWCVTSAGVVPGTANQTLYIDECSDDPAQLWQFGNNLTTVSNADGNCITLGKAGFGDPITLDECSIPLAPRQQWIPVLVVT